MSTSTSTQIPNQKASNNRKRKKKKTTSFMNSTVNKLKLDRESCEKFHSGRPGFHNFRYIPIKDGYSTGGPDVVCGYSRGFLVNT